MRMRYWMMALVALCGVTLGGCNQTPPTPPPGATTETETLDIDHGIEVPAAEVGQKTDATPEAPAGNAKTDAGTTGSK
jgi:hypothetical protein